MTSGDEDDLKYQQLEQEVASYDDTPGISSEPHYEPATQRPSAEQYSEQRHREPEPQYQQQHYQPQAPDIPDVNDDPVGHFQARASVVEADRAGWHVKAFWDDLEKNETQFAGELEENEYTEATEALKEHRMAQLYQQWPDNHATAALALQHGFQSPAHMRAYQLTQDTIAVAQNAYRNGRSPAQEFYRLAVEHKLHRPKSVMTKSYRRHVMKNLDRATPEQFSEWWKYYEKASKQVEGS